MDYKDQSGKRRSRQFKTKKEATDYETKVRAEIAAGIYMHAADSVSVEEACRQYLEHLKVRRDTGQTMEPATYVVYESCIRRHILDLKVGLGAVKLASLRTKTVADFRDRLLSSGRSVAMTKRIIATLGFMLKHARANDLIFTDPVEGVVVRRQSRSSSAISLEAAQQLRDNVKKLLGAADDDFRPYLVVAALAGLRASEQRGLRWENVDLTKGIIRVRERADIFNKIGDPKSEAGTRDIPIGPMVTNTLKAWKLKCPTSELGLVFPNRKGGVRTQTDVHRLWFKPLCGKLGITMRWHDLRHFAVSAWIDQGFSIKAVMTFAGHKDYRMTMERYGKLFPSEDHHKAVADMEKRLFG
ncbi:tyrosine-type recombinase/integrase [Azospirillum soli]|uniref:tyrosine-type recombinase/integrase n=1 Tax=Azospirillum soli TaxID=1304799 RepID=UPI0031B81165|nr:integrase [Azospirillum soli]